MIAVLVILVLASFFFVPILIGIKKGKGIKRENEEAQRKAEENLKNQGFNIEKCIGISAKLYVDNTHKLWAVKEWNTDTDVRIHRFSELTDFELIENGERLAYGGIGKTLVRKPVTMNNRAAYLVVKVNTNDSEHPQYLIQFIKDFSLSKSSADYKKFFASAQEAIDALDCIATSAAEN